MSLTLGASVRVATIKMRSRVDDHQGQTGTVIGVWDLEKEFRLFPVAVRFDDGCELGFFDDELEPARSSDGPSPAGRSDTPAGD